jgi:hypothetical protein
VLISVFRSGQLVDSVGFGLLLFGRDGLIIDCNDAAFTTATW